VLNAARENIPLLFTAGRTPILEEGAVGARSVFIHWGQEMFDQAGMLREAVKWDYELRTPKQVEAVVDRALTIAMSEPMGPVYLSLPREVLADGAGEFSFAGNDRRRPARPPAPEPAAIEEAADMLAAAKNPLVITGSLGKHADVVPAFAALVEKFALPVISFRPRYLNLPGDHPMHLGYEPQAYLPETDVALVFDSDVPWLPSLHKVNPDIKVIQIGTDPLFSQYPIRSFPSQLAITASPATAIPALSAALSARGKPVADAAEARRPKIAEAWAKQRATWAAALDRVKAATPIETPWLAHCIGEAMGDDDILVSETQIPLPFLNLNTPGRYFATPTAGGLGWSMGAALGIKLAEPEKTVINVLGDGAYMFNGPTPAHYVSRAMDLPILTIIVNNGMWGSVRKATLGQYPDGAASKSNRAPLTVFDPAPDYEKVCEASGGYGECVDNPADLPDAIARGLKMVREEGRQVVLNVRTSYSDQQALADAKR